MSENQLIRNNHNSSKSHHLSVKVGDTEMTFEFGKIAKQTSASIVARWGDSVILTTVCTGPSRPGTDFFPLTCEYIEKAYAAGKIPGGFFKRETRPREHEILNARITDRSIRPLFPDGFRDDVQIVTTVLSHDGEHDTDALALCAASMALHVSELPFAPESGPIAGVRVARVNGTLIAAPTETQKQDSDLDLVVAVSKDAIVMVEGGADELSEEEMVEALFFAHEAGQDVIQSCHDMRAKVGKDKMVFEAPEIDAELFAKVEKTAHDKGIVNAIATRDKIARYAEIDAVKAVTKETLKEELGEDAYEQVSSEISKYFGTVKANHIRQTTVNEKARLDGRAFTDIRAIDCETKVLPRTHGSSVFTRGETQAIVTATLGTREDEQKLDTLMGEHFERFMLHYNFPPFSVGEARPLRSTSRREMGHGALATRAVRSVIPEAENFPYTLRVVSEITESNGSSSMASVCGASMALMDAGVPLRCPVAGIAMGLIQEDDKIAVLSDILGDEDHIGDMDFKVCGTEKGIVAIQMDIKIDGLTREIMTTALNQAKEGRLHILNEMGKAITKHRDELSETAPRILEMKINPDKIRDVIGPGGKTIRDITMRTNAKVSIEDNGSVQIFGIGPSTIEAKNIIEELTQEPIMNMIYRGVVKRCVDFGAFVEIFNGCDGLVHISELADKRVEKVTDVVQEGDEVNVKVIRIERDGKIRLSRKQADGAEVGSVASA